MRTVTKLVLCVCVAAVAASPMVANSGEKEKKKKDKAVERTRETVRMLDDVYKTVVVLVTEHYVKDETSLSAGTAAKALFAAIKKKGWHDVALLDASGEPYNDENVARDDFDREAIKQLKAGQSFYDQVESKDGKRYLRAATPIPVVMKKCTLCHPNYEKAKKGEPIGILSYTLPIK